MPIGIFFNIFRWLLGSLDSHHTTWFDVQTILFAHLARWLGTTVIISFLSFRWCKGLIWALYLYAKSIRIRVNLFLPITVSDSKRKRKRKLQSENKPRVYNHSPKIRPHVTDVEQTSLKIVSELYGTYLRNVIFHVRKEFTPVPTVVYRKFVNPVFVST